MTETHDTLEQAAEAIAGSLRERFRLLALAVNRAESFVGMAPGEGPLDARARSSAPSRRSPETPRKSAPSRGILSSERFAPPSSPRTSLCSKPCGGNPRLPLRSSPRPRG